MYKGDFSRKSTLSQYGFRLPSCLDNRPLKRRLAKNYDNFTIWNRTLERAEHSINHINKHNVVARKFDLQSLSDSLNAGDVVVSQLPASHHLSIAKLCINKKCHFALQGPKLRVGEFKNTEEALIKGQKFILDSNSALGDDKRVNFPHSEIYDHLTPNSTLLINDGRIRLQVIEQHKDKLITEVLNDGIISNNKGCQYS